ncbi:MAG TPA: hypothetical protein VGN12_00160 [Pirellulales bacterium]|jgi:hypothetical protein
MRRLIGFTTWAMLAVVLTAGIAQAEDFHVDSRVYKVGETKPLIETTTLFYKGVTYDFLKDPQENRDPEVTIFDAPRERFVVLDPERKITTEVKLNDVQDFIRKVRIEAAASPNPLLNFLSNPTFTEKETDEGELEFTSSWMIYRLKTIAAKSDEVARQYGDFSHWHSQLNVMINPQTLPPFGRMAVSEQLEQRKLLPTDIYMTISPKGPQPKLIIRAEHRFQYTMIERDRQMVDEAQRQMKLFRQVTLAEYNERLKEAPADSKQAKGKSTRK